MRAHRHRGGHLAPGDDPARGENRRGRTDRLDRRGDLGHEHHRRNFAAVTARFSARDDEDIDPGADLREGVIARADERGDGDIVALAEFEHQRRRHAERVGDQVDRVAEGDFEQLGRAVVGHVFAEAAADGGEGEIIVVNPMLLEQCGDEGFMFGRDRGQCASALAFTREAVGDDQIDAIGLAADMRVDPRQFLLKPFGRERSGAEDAHAARFRHRDDDIAAVREGEEGEFDGEHRADG